MDIKSALRIRLRSANLIVARSSGCNKAGYRAATTRRCQNNGSLANGEAFIQRGYEGYCTVELVTMYMNEPRLYARQALERFRALLPEDER